jgi:hypothetical protein
MLDAGLELGAIAIKKKIVSPETEPAEEATAW